MTAISPIDDGHRPAPAIAARLCRHCAVRTTARRLASLTSIGESPIDAKSSRRRGDGSV
jgi:hypothetical protein